MATRLVFILARSGAVVPVLGVAALFLQVLGLLPPIDGFSDGPL